MRHASSWARATGHKCFRKNELEAFHQLRCFRHNAARSVFDAVTFQQSNVAALPGFVCQRQVLWQHLLIHAEYYARHQLNAWDLALQMGPKSPGNVVQTAGEHGLGILSRVVSVECGAEGAKLLLELPDARRVETVIVSGNRRRASCVPTVCVSSQAGCAMACRFCDTGLLGGGSNAGIGLPGWAILEQIFHAEAFVQREYYAGSHQRSVAPAGRKSMNVVFMGMGEPLLNYANVLDAVRVLCAEENRRRVTLSTVGISPRIRSLASDAPHGLQLALSLHAPTQQLREKLLPRAARAWQLPDVLDACCQFEKATGSTVLLEYILLRGINDEEIHARELAALISSSGLTCAGVNLIPYNPTTAGALASFETPSDARCKAFRFLLRQANVPNVTIRFSTKAGRRVTAACGQLGLKSVGRPSPFLS